MHVNKSFPSKMAVQSPPIPEGDEEEVKWGGGGDVRISWKLI